MYASVLTRVGLFLFLSFIVVASANLAAQSDQGLAARTWGLGQPQSSGDLPPGQLRRKLESLPPQAHARALKWLQEISFTGTDLESLQIDDSGNVLFVDPMPTDLGANQSAPAVEEAPATTLEDAFLLHSKPGAPNVVFLDFDGHSFTNTAWASGTINAVPFNLDSDPNTFNDAERTAIADIWHRVADDLAPFNVDVTTEEPLVFNSYTGRLLITRNTQADSSPMPYSSSGGVAYVNVFGLSSYHTYYSPALVYFNNLSNLASNIAEATSHEFGHNLGLSHDGTTSSVEYYAGHGSGLVSWAPIMGVGYTRNVTQWSKGEYTGANQTQDDIAIITSKLTVVADDHGDSIGFGSLLEVAPDGSVVSSNPELDPHNVLPENKGIISSRADVDVFTFTSGAGPASLEITPAWDAFYNGTSRRGANLDIRAELYNAAGTLVASSDPTTDTKATLSATLSAGTHHLMVIGIDNPTVPYTDYGSLGMYFINGSITTGTADTNPPTPNPMTWANTPAAIGENAISMTATTASDDNSSVQYRFNCVSGGAGCVNSAWQSSTSYTATGLAAATQYTFSVVARDASLNQTAASQPASATTDAPPPPPPLVDNLAQSSSAIAGSVSGSFSDTHSDNGVAQAITEIESGGKPSSRYTYLEHHWSFNLGTGVSATVYANAWSSGSSDGDTFNFQYSLNGGNSWTTMFNVSETSNANVKSFALPGAPSGAVLLRVIDTARSAGGRDANTVFIDHLYIQVHNPSTEPPDGGAVGLSANSVSSSQINLSWTDGANNETGYRVERSLNGSTGWVQVADLEMDSQAWSDTGLAASTTYFYRVRAFNSQGNSAWASTSATTQSPPPPPSAPTGLGATGISSSQINLSWSHSGNNEDGFRVERRPAGSGSYVAIASLGVNATSYSDLGLAAGASYDYRVFAFNGGGEAVSNVATGSTLAPPAISLNASGFKSKGLISIDLSWTGAGGSVDVYRNGSKIASAVSGSSYRDNTGSKGSGTFTHEVCLAGSTTTCSNTTTTVF
ncbi:MAG TPA: fibronectin type III domain-containing protein [Xanthomonadales bacterium]|nr:fibronectin type III domain-containing protein [Xanthomonadales bacterium]